MRHGLRGFTAAIIPILMFAGFTLAASTLAANPAVAEGDPDRGERVFRRCVACHTVNEGGGHRQGPNLHGIFGAAAGAKAGYNYSKAMTNSGVVWNEETIAEYARRPREFIPGNRMIFVGIRDDGQIDDLIAYLRKATQ